MNGQWMSTSAISALLDHTSTASTRRWIDRAKLEAKGRNVDTGEKLYLRSDVEAAIAAMPGKGARTDLHPTEEPAPDDRDRLGSDDQPH